MKKQRKKKTTQQKQSNKGLSGLTKLTRIIAVPIAIEQIEKLASTDERKTIWVLCSGKLTREKLASKSGVSLRTTTTFIDSAMTYGLLEEEKGKGGHPKRVIDYVPSSWKKLVKKKKRPEEQKEKVSLETS
jgi:hypothetical protein